MLRIVISIEDPFIKKYKIHAGIFSYKVVYFNIGINSVCLLVALNFNGFFNCN